MNELDPSTALRDRRILYATAFLRALATGMIGVTIGLYLARLGRGADTTSLVIAAGLVGGALAGLVATIAGDRWGRRRFLIALALLGTIGALAAGAAAHPLWIGVAAFVGMLNGMGRDRGAALILEQAILPATTTHEQRTRAFARYNVLQDAGHALGSLVAGAPKLAARVRDFDELRGYQILFVVYAILMLVAAALYLRLSSPPAESATRERLRVSPETRKILLRISSLFALDSLGGGFLTSALMSYFFHERFGVGGDWIAALYFLARVANALSHLGAAWLARRIGLVNTMVFTHIPSSLLLVTVAFAPNFWVAAILFLLREGLVEMDVPTRQSYVMALVRPEERTFASGVTNLVRMGAWAVAPSIAGFFMKALTDAAPLFVGAGLKIVYDVALYVQFRKVRPPEENS